MRRQLRPALLMMLVFTVLTGLAYPLLVTGIAQTGFAGKANGSLVKQGGTVVGSRLLGQSFTDARGRPLPQYFQSRPSAATGVTGKTQVGYDPTLSSGSNLGPTNPNLLSLVAQRVRAYRSFNGLAPDQTVPVDAVTASGSGLDPDISVLNARLQAPRVARHRHLPLGTVLGLVDSHRSGRTLGFLGEPTVNVLSLNVALDSLRS
ncbi:MAG TPA: K(+)-transporting ATPase subunit C [Acidimicrobiia bacterium]|nr:K(+)-transporting ATPase subunit C [Acidimicrobiia bacterium]